MCSTQGKKEISNARPGPAECEKTRENLKIQLEEIESLQSMFYKTGEFEIDPNLVAETLSYIEDTNIPEHNLSRLDFMLNIDVDGNLFEMCVNLPLEYPEDEPDIYVRNGLLKREQQSSLNHDLIAYLHTREEGSVCIYILVVWLQDHAVSYFEPEPKKKTKGGRPRPLPVQLNDEPEKFVRLWVYSHHVYNKMKRRSIVEFAKENNITGFSLPGKPGLMCFEGWETNTEECWLKVRALNWKHITCTKREEEEARGSPLEAFRRFENFQEVSFDKGKRLIHQDMGEFFKYLSNHQSGYMFEEFLGIAGKKAK